MTPDLVVGLVSIALPSMACLFVLWATFLGDKLILPPSMEAFLLYIPPPLLPAASF